MTEDDKWQYLGELDERLLQGGVILSEWATFLINDADTAFVGGAYLASIITGLAGVETHLRGEGGSSKKRLVELIDHSDLEEDLKQELQFLRRYRNNIWGQSKNSLREENATSDLGLDNLDNSRGLLELRIC